MRILPICVEKELEIRFNNTLKNNTIRCKKLATIFLGLKTWYDPLSGENRYCCYFSALVFTYFCLTQDRVSFLKPEIVVMSFLHVMVLILQSAYQTFLKTTVYGVFSWKSIYIKIIVSKKHLQRCITRSTFS